MKKIRAFVCLTLALLVALPINVCAANAEGDNEFYSEVEVTESGNVRTCVTSDNVSKYTVSYDREKNTVTATIENLLTGSTCSNSSSISNNSNNTYLPVSSPYAVTIEQDTDLKFKYVITTGTTYEWRLVRPKLSDEGTGTYYFKCWENSSNEDELDSFRIAVNDLALNEAHLRNCASVVAANDFFVGILTVAAIATNGVLAPAAIAAVIASAGLQGDAIEAGEVVAVSFNECMYAIEDAYYATDNMHF